MQSVEAFEELLECAKVRPGDEIRWANGTYDDVELDVSGVDGTEKQPIVLRAETPGGVRFRGESTIRVGTKWWVIRGFHFEGRPGEENAYNAVVFRDNGGTEAEHVRLTDCAMTDLHHDGTSKWIQVYGRFNTIDHCHFSGKRTRGALITVELGGLGPGETAEHRIEANYFADFAAGEGTDNETIRVGYSGDQDKPAKCLVRGNYFVRCDGENEIVSNKSSFNRYVGNTFRQCNGALVLRHGHHAHVEGNYFFGDGAENAGGIRIVDSHHTVVNNYMENLTGTTWNAALSILGGRQRSGGGDNGYQAVDGVVIAHNTILNCRRSLYLNDAKGNRSPTGTVANNLIASRQGPLVVDELGIAGLAWRRNLFHGPDVGVNVEAVRADPGLKRTEGLLRPDPSGPVADAAAPITRPVDRYVEGQRRSKPDIGAEEVSKAEGNVTSPPLTPDRVGTSFLRGRGPEASNAARTEPAVAPAPSSRLPGDVLDLANWKLTLPVDTERTGRPDEIPAAELPTFASPFFAVTTDGKGVRFRAPCGGTTTKGSDYPRCELREMTDEGRRPAAWGTDDGGVHTLTTTLAITRTPVVKRHVVCAQIHDADDDLLMIRLEGSKLFVERNDVGDVSIDRDYQRGDPIELRIEAANGRVRVWQGARRVLDWPVKRTGCYFKVGCYTQSNTKKGDAADATGEVVVHELHVEHRR